MYIQFYFAVFISAAAFVASEINENGLTITGGVGVGVGSRRDQTDKRAKRAVSTSDRDTILNTFNYQRSLVGASDMNYVSWDSSSLEDYVNSYIMDCDFDAEFKPLMDCIYFKIFNDTNFGHKRIIEYFFASSNYGNWVKSKYLLHVSGSYKYCATFTVKGRKWSNVHFYVYGITRTSEFNQYGIQYTRGDACTRCQHGVNWCYNNLCRGDCKKCTPGCCPIVNNIPAECDSSSLKCGSSIIEVKTSVMVVAMVSAMRFCFQ